MSNIFIFKEALKSENGKFVRTDVVRLTFFLNGKKDRFAVVKFFGDDVPFTVKFWKGNYETTKKYWSTSVKFQPPQELIQRALRIIGLEWFYSN